MSSVDFFDDVERDAAAARPDKPIWAIDRSNEEELLKWLKGELTYLKDESTERIRLAQRNLALYKGIQYLDQDRRDIQENNQRRNQPVRKIVINHLYDLVQNRVSRLIKYKPAVAVLPTNDEFGDQVSADVVDSLLSHIWYVNNFEGRISVEWAKQCAVLGESYLFCEWNPDKGDLHPDYVKEKKLYESKGEKVPLIGEDGSQEKDESGKPIFVDRPVRVGDVEYDVVMTTEVFPEGCHKWEDVNYLFRRKVMSVERARLLYPKKADKIKSAEHEEFYDYNKMEIRASRNETVIYDFYHKRSLGADKGLWIVFTENAILSVKDFPYDHTSLPCIRLTDLDIPGELHGMAGIENVKALTSTYNNLNNLVLRNQILVSHAKWMMPAGAAKKESLGNDITIVEYKGPTPPVLVQANPTPNELFTYMTSIKEQAQQIYGAFGVSRGDPPPGITAGVALQWMSEQESERFNEMVLKWNEAIRQLAIMTISVCGTYYDSSDQRMLRVLGKNQQWMSQFFDVTHLSKDYDVRMQNASALPQSKAARKQTLIDLNKEFPGLFTPEQVIDMLDLAADKKYVNQATVNVRTASAENEKLLHPNEGDNFQIEPAIYDDHVIHWKIHVRQTQEWSFKYQTPEDVQQKLIDHLTAHEMLMLENADKNPAYRQAITMLPGFPLFYIAPPAVAVMPQPPMGAEAAGPPQMSEQFQEEEGAAVNLPPPPAEAQVATEEQTQTEPPVAPTGAQ